MPLSGECVTPQGGVGLCVTPWLIFALPLTQGHIHGKPESRVALSTCSGGLNGVVFDGEQTYFIHPHEDGSGRLQDDHFLLRWVNEERKVQIYEREERYGGRNTEINKEE